MLSRAALLSLYARLARLEADAAGLRAQVAPWLELNEQPAPDAAASSGSGDAASAARTTPGASSKDRIEDAANSDSGAFPPASDTRPPAKGARPAGASLPERFCAFKPCGRRLEQKPGELAASFRRRLYCDKTCFGKDCGGRHAEGRMTVPQRLLALLAEHARSGAVLPSDRHLAERIGTTPQTVTVALSRLKSDGSIAIRRDGGDRFVTLLREQAAAAPEAPVPEAPAPGPPAKPDPERDAIERFLAEKGATRCPTAFTDVSTGSSSEAERAAIARHREEMEARRRAEMEQRRRRA